MSDSLFITLKVIGGLATLLLLMVQLAILNGF